MGSLTGKVSFTLIVRYVTYYFLYISMSTHCIMLSFIMTLAGLPHGATDLLSSHKILALLTYAVVLSSHFYCSTEDTPVSTEDPPEVVNPNDDKNRATSALYHMCGMMPSYIISFEH